MKYKEVDTVTNNDEHVRLRIYDGVITMDQAAAELLELTRADLRAAEKARAEAVERFNTLLDRVLSSQGTP